MFCKERRSKEKTRCAEAERERCEKVGQQEGGCFRRSITPLPHLKRAAWQWSEAGSWNWTFPSISATAFHPLTHYKCMLAVLYWTRRKSNQAPDVSWKTANTSPGYDSHLFTTLFWPQASESPSDWLSAQLSALPLTHPNTDNELFRRITTWSRECVCPRYPTQSYSEHLRDTSYSWTSHHFTCMLE